jgi:hypothetical protein
MTIGDGRRSATPGRRFLRAPADYLRVGDHPLQRTGNIAGGLLGDRARVLIEHMRGAGVDVQLDGREIRRADVTEAARAEIGPRGGGPARS